MTADLKELGAEKYLQLTTYRKSGDGVPTPVWVVQDGDSLLVYTDLTSGKVKRLRHTPGVTLTPCDMRGRVPDGATTTQAVATVAEDPDAIKVLRGKVIAKYGLFARLFVLSGDVMSAIRRKPQTPAVIRITAVP